MQLIALAVATVLTMGPNGTILSSTVFYGSSSVQVCHDWKAERESYPLPKINLTTGRPNIGTYYNCILMEKDTLDNLAAESFEEIEAKKFPSKSFR